MFQNSIQNFDWNSIYHRTVDFRPLNYTRNTLSLLLKIDTFIINVQRSKFPSLFCLLGRCDRSPRGKAFHEARLEERVGRTGHLDPRRTRAPAFASPRRFVVSPMRLSRVDLPKWLQTASLFLIVADACDRSCLGLPPRVYANDISVLRPIDISSRSPRRAALASPLEFVRAFA